MSHGVAAACNAASSGFDSHRRLFSSRESRDESRVPEQSFASSAGTCLSTLCSRLFKQAPLMSIVQRRRGGSEEFRRVCSGHGF